MKNKFLSSILVLVLLIGAVLPAYAAVKIATDYKEKSELAAFYGEDFKILICTSDGFKYVSIAELESGETGHENGVNCELCLAGAVKDTATNPKLSYVSFFAADAETVASNLEADDVTSLVEKEGKQSRAPPENS